ncbi:extracellular solute-binding protein [Streptomyces triticirhizae]|uniref:extracellular solute-binding protein n=1 Tax=Streptomyces triticirhizae TaxID=2483353 RepID=UPI0011C37C1C|nr:extracellular solute-binding protein [Streptomyces triticirhizae]
MPLPPLGNPTHPPPGRAGPGRRALLRGLGAAALAAPLASCGFVPASRDDRLSFMFWGSTQEEASVNEVSRRYSERPDRLAIDTELVSYNGYATKMHTLVAARQEPDIAYAPQDMAMRLGEGGYLVNFLDYRDRFEALDDFLPQTIHYWDDEGAVFQTAIETMVTWYNADLFETAGAPLPPTRTEDAWTWDELVATAERLTFDVEGRRPSERGFDAERVEQYGLMAPAWWFSPALYALLRSNDADAFDEDGTRCVIDSDAAVEVISAVADLIHEHRVAPSPTQLATFNNGLALMMRSGKIAMGLDGYWHLLDLAAADFPYGVGVMPRFQDEALTCVTSGATCVFNRSLHPEQAVEFYLEMADPERCTLYADGLWMPLRRSYYTDPRLLASWCDTEIHPAGFVDSFVEPLLHHAVQEPVYRVREGGLVNSRLTPGLDPIWLGEVRGRDAVARHLRGVADRVDSYLTGVYPDVRGT